MEEEKKDGGREAMIATLKKMGEGKNRRNLQGWKK